MNEAFFHPWDYWTFFQPRWTITCFLLIIQPYTGTSIVGLLLSSMFFAIGTLIAVYEFLPKGELRIELEGF